MNKTTLLKIALLCSVFSLAQNIDTTKYQKVTPGDTVRNYYNQNHTTPDDGIKDYYPPDKNPQEGQQQGDTPKNYQPDKSYPSRNQRGGNGGGNTGGNNGGNTSNTTTTKQSADHPPIVDKLYYGAYVYFNAGAVPGYSIINYELSPHVGYKFTDKLSAGVQVLYLNSIETGSGSSISYSLYGGGVFGRFIAIKLGYTDIFFQAEYDALAVPSNYLGNTIIKRSASEEKMVGLGLKRTYGKVSMYLMGMYDISPSFNSPYYGSPLVIRFGFSYNW